MKDRTNDNYSNLHSIFYFCDLETEEIIWIGDTELVLGLSKSQLGSRKKFSELLHDDDKRAYKFNMDNFVEEISCHYSIKLGDEFSAIKEIAVKTSEGGKNIIQGIITKSNMAEDANEYNKYSISNKSILTGKFDPLFLDTLSSAFKSGVKNSDSYVLLLLSIDNLPMVMTWQGEEVANEIMYDISEKVKDSLPNESTFYRINIDQFGIIIKNPAAKYVDDLVNKINYMINIYRNPSMEDAVHLRLSIGSVYFPIGVDDEFDAINKAYLALTNVKGKDYEFYCDYEDAKREHIDAQNEMTQLHYLQEAFHDDRLVLAYQPIISSADGGVEYYECLLRIADGKGNFDSAGRFIPIAEKMGTVDVIDEYVLKSVVAELEKNAGLKLCLNVSNLTTSNEQWLRMCSEVLGASDVSNRISVEITETAAQKNLRKTAYFTAAMQSLGCDVALDDFGVGYTSFRQLRSLSVNTVKIDGSYVLGLEENKENMIFIKSLVDFNKSYGLKTVAECVETGEVAKKLMELGVDYLQGYYFGKPATQKPWLSS